jgi:hypothetical protein
MTHTDDIARSAAEIEAEKERRLAAERERWRNSHEMLSEVAQTRIGAFKDAATDKKPEQTSEVQQISAIILAARRAFELEVALRNSEGKTDEERRREQDERERLKDLAEFNKRVRARHAREMADAEAKADAEATRDDDAKEQTP